MRGAAIVVLLGFTAVMAYAQGRQDRSAFGSTVLSQAPAAYTASPSSAGNRGGRVAKARIALDSDRRQPVPTPSLSSPSTTNPYTPNPTTQPELKRKEEVALTVAAIAANPYAAAALQETLEEPRALTHSEKARVIDMPRLAN
jgi:hypothetical protein